MFRIIILKQTSYKQEGKINLTWHDLVARNAEVFRSILESDMNIIDFDFR